MSGINMETIKTLEMINMLVTKSKKWSKAIFRSHIRKYG